MAMDNLNINIINNENDNNNNNPNKRVSRGRQVVAMMKMANESNLQVTFSKRRSGLFKKASELCTLCGVDLAIIVFSPGRRVFSFGHSSVNLVIDRYLNPENYRMTSQVNSATLQLVEAHRNANVRDLNQKLSHVMEQLDVERKRSSELKKARKARVSLYWWEAPVEALNDLAHLQYLKSAMETLKKATSQQADQILIQTTTNANSLLPPNFNNINVNTPSFYGAVTTVGGGGNGSERGLPSSAAAFPNQGGAGKMLQQPNNNYRYYNKNNNNNNNNDNNVGEANSSSAGTSTDIPHLQAAITSGVGSVNHVNMPHIPQMQAMNSGGIVNNHVNLQPHMQVAFGGGSTVNHVNLPPHMQVNNSSGGGGGVNHINFSPMPHPMQQDSAPAGNTNHINMSAMPHMQAKSSPAAASSVVINHFNMSPMPHMQQPNTCAPAPGTVNHVNQLPPMQLPMLPQSLPPSSQLLSQQPNPQGTHHALNNNVGCGHGFF